MPPPLAGRQRVRAHDDLAPSIGEAVLGVLKAYYPFPASSAEHPRSSSSSAESGYAAAMPFLGTPSGRFVVVLPAPLAMRVSEAFFWDGAVEPGLVGPVVTEFCNQATASALAAVAIPCTGMGIPELLEASESPGLAEDRQAVSGCVATPDGVLSWFLRFDDDDR